jgi:hypothetical protein
MTNWIQLGEVLPHVLQDAAREIGGTARRSRTPFIHGPAKVVFGNVTPIKPANWNKGAAHPHRGGQQRMRR